MSALPWIFGEETTVAPEKFQRVENQPETWTKAAEVVRGIARRLEAQLRTWTCSTPALSVSEKGGRSFGFPGRFPPAGRYPCSPPGATSSGNSSRIPKRFFNAEIRFSWSRKNALNSAITFG